MPKTPTAPGTAVALEHRAVNSHLTIWQVPNREGLDFKLTGIEQMELTFENLNLFGLTSTVLHKGSNLLRFVNHTEPAKFTMQFEEPSAKQPTSTVMRGPIIVIPPPTT